MYGKKVHRRFLEWFPDDCKEIVRAEDSEEVSLHLQLFV